jgi:hypothetical protein
VRKLGPALRRTGPLTLKNVLSVLVLFVAVAAWGERVRMVPTTTLQSETSNNTSASDSWRGSNNGNLPAGNVSKVPLLTLLYPGATTKLLSAMQGWFGNPKHISVGYNSADPAQVRRQLADMKSRGFDGVTIAWYGSEANDQSNLATLTLRAEAEKVPGLTFALRVNEGAVKWYAHGRSPTDALIFHMNYAADAFFTSPAYLRINGRPVVFEFGLESLDIDWNRVKSAVRGNPLWIFRNANGFTRPNSAGAFAWGPANKLDYLDWFYGKALAQQGKSTVGNAYKGFDDRLASWSKGRVIDQRCGQTWLDTFAYANKYYSARNQLPFLMVSTWNDYEEGTEIETGIDNCLTLSAAISANSLSWALSGNGQENTIHHYTVFISTDGQNLMPLADLRNGENTLDLVRYELMPGTYTMFVKAAGKPSIRNLMSNPVRLVVLPRAAR